MDKWADYLISEVSYDSEHLISAALRHQETEQGITKGKPIDRLTIASDIKNGLTYITIYSGKNSWKKGHQIQTFSIEGIPYLRIDRNKVKLDFLGDIQEFPIPKSESIKKLDLAPEPITEPEEDEATPEQLARLKQLEKQIEELEFHPEPITEPEILSSPRGSLPKDSAEELPQELDLAPEPITEPEEDEATPEQLARLKQLEKQIEELEFHPEPITEPEILSSPRGSLPKDSAEELPQELDLAPEPITEQSSQLNDLQQQISELENILSTKLNPSKDLPINQTPKVNKSQNPVNAEIEQKIIHILQKQNQKLDDIEKELHKSTTKKTIK